MLRALARLTMVSAAASAGCVDVTVPADPGRVETVRVVPFAAWLQPGDTLRMTALPLDPDGLPISREVEVSWRSLSPALAEVDGSGRVTAVRPGDAEIVAVIEDVEGSALVHVLRTPEAFSPFRLITAGDDFTCGVDVRGVTACWGLNALGQLGNGGLSGGRVPTAVAGLAGVTAVAAGTRHACAIDDEGQPWCWGWNSVGQVGPDVTQKIAAVPLPITLAGRFTALAAGSGHSCALRDDGAAFCWGAGALGQLGGGLLPSVGMARVAAPVPFISLVAGHAHTCGLDNGGVAWCWGWNDSGQVGTETADCGYGIPCSARPVPVRTTLRFRSLAAGSGFTCGLEADGRAHCWGANADGQLGGQPGPSTSVPTPVSGVPALVQLAAGREHACGIDRVGVLFCWGANRRGQLGDGTTIPRSGPVVAGVAPDPGIRIAAGGAHSCAIGTDGSVACWGNNSAGQLGLHPAWQ